MKDNRYIYTFTGKKFWPFDPNPEDICIEDIAHALSLKCRFTGHTRELYCQQISERTLTDDLRWVPVGSLHVGDGLLAFDEYPTTLGQGGRKKRLLRPAVVTHHELMRSDIIALTLEDGTILRSTPEHPYLIATKQSHNQKWVSAMKIKADLEGINARYRKTGSGYASDRFMLRFVRPWELSSSWKAGRLAGLYDGEGYVRAGSNIGTVLGLSQNPGELLTEAGNLINEFGGFFRHNKSSSSKHDCATLVLQGGWPEVLRLLGTIGSTRLSAKITKAIRDNAFARQLNGLDAPLRIVAAENVGRDWVAAMSTSTRTYFCEGFGSHNSVAEHSVRVARLLRSRECPHPVVFYGLMHDAAEAYLPDVASPIKAYFPLLVETEREVMRAIADKFGIGADGAGDLVKWADMTLLSTEGRDLFPSGLTWGVHRNWPPLADRIAWTWAPERAEKLFLDAFRTYVPMSEAARAAVEKETVK